MDGNQAWWLHPLRDIAAGTVGGIGGKLIEFPFDTVKVRLQSALQNGISSTTNQRALSVLRKIVANEGIIALYRGMSLPLAGTVLETATLFTANGYLKRYLSDLGHMKPTDDLPMQYVLLAGAGTGFCVSWVLTPIELIKCRLQVQSAGGGGGADTSSSSSSTARRILYKGPIDCLLRSIKEENLSVLYRGHIGTVLREVPGTACWFGAYETFVRAMTPSGKTRSDLPAWVIVTAGALGGMSYWSIMYPADTVKSVMQTMDVGVVTTTTTTASSGGGGGGGGDLIQKVVRGPAPTFGGTLSRLYKSVGLRGLYAGMLPTFLRAAPSNAVIFLGYEYSADVIGKAMGLSSPVSTSQME